MLAAVPSSSGICGDFAVLSLLLCGKKAAAVTCYIMIIFNLKTNQVTIHLTLSSYTGYSAFAMILELVQLPVASFISPNPVAYNLIRLPCDGLAGRCTTCERLWY